ncbi:MAG: PDZ domain-containing protein [Proteobacteria bacterium]|nr:PDZ domain-containing protein [Pseudomonadota bacterium]
MKHLQFKRISFIFFLILSIPSFAQFPFGFETQKKGLTCERIPLIMQFMLAKHVMIKKLDSTLKERTIEEYIKGVDPSKTLLLTKDVSEIKNLLSKFFDDLKKRDCGALKKIQDISISRAIENEAFMKEFLGDKYVLDENVEIVTDPDKRQFSSTQKDKEQQLIKYAHFQISNYLLAGTEIKEAKKLLFHRYEIITKRLKEKPENKFYDDFVKAHASAFDPHTNYLSLDDFEDFQITMRLSLEGIGAQLSSEDGFTVVEEIIPGGAADRAKVLLQKDKIIAVGQVPKKKGAKVDSTNVIDMDLKDVVRLIRGPKDSQVQLTLLRKAGSETKRMEVVIKRDKISLKDQEAKLKIEERKIGDRTLKLGVIDLPSFYGDQEEKRSSYADVKKLLEQAKKDKVEGILLDMNQNGGGLLEAARQLGGLFIREGGIVATKDYEGSVRQLVDDDSSVVWSGPLVLLTSRASASAAEILAGAMKDYKRALIIGADHTFGKGSVQEVNPFAYDMGAIKITTALFFLPGGQTTQHQGVSSHIVLPSTLNTDKIGEKSLDYSLQPQKIAPFVSTKANADEPLKAWVPITDSLVKRLAKNSEKRVKTEAKFAEILKEIEEAKKNQDVIKLADFRKKAKEDKKKEDEDKKKTLAQRKDAYVAPYINEGLNILADLVVEEEKDKKTAQH